MLLIPKVYTPIGVEDGTVEGTEHSDFEKVSVFFKSQSQEKKKPWIWSQELGRTSGIDAIRCDASGEP